MNAKLPQTDFLLLQLLDAGVEGIVAFDREYRYIAWNKGMERITGLKREAVLGRCALEVFPFLKEIGQDKYFRATLAGESVTSPDRPYAVPETGRAGFFRGYYSPLRDQQNQIIGGIAVIWDITERKHVEEAAQEAQQRLTLHMENSPLAVIEWDTDFRVSRWSASAERLFGWKPHEVLGKHVSDWHFVFDEDVDAVERVTNRQRVGTELLGVQHNRNYTKDGSVLYCEWYNSVLHDESGKLLSVLSLVLDVTTRELAEEERAALLASERELRERAEKADRLKDEFLATLSHELRTPLTSILGWATMIRNGDLDRTENLDRALEIIERNARSQARLIDDLLDVSRIITGNLQLEVRPLNLAPIVETAIEALRPAADAKGIRIETQLDAAACLVSGDANRLRQVIWNLLMNAIKFTPSGGRVNLHLECFNALEEQGKGGTGKGEGKETEALTGQAEAASASISPLPLPPSPLQSSSPLGSFVRLIVSDNGDGITPEFLPYVFHRFRQEEGSISRKAGGLGLGLAVVRHLVELHGGSVGAESAGPGEGSTFTVDLPLAADRRDHDLRAAKAFRNTFERRGRDGDGDSETVVRSATKANGSADGKSASAAGEKPLGGVRVLLVEDDEDSRNLLGLLLSRYGSDVVSVSSSAAALDAFVQKTPDVVISDIGMAEEDGYELIRKLRMLPLQSSLLGSSANSARRNPQSAIPQLVPAIALTGYATVKDRERVLAAGYQLHLAKPVEPDELVAAILSLLDREI